MLRRLVDHCRGVLQERNELIDPALGPSAHQCRQFPVGGQEYLGETISARGVDGEGAQVRLAGATLNPAIADESPQHTRHRCRPHPGAAGEGSGGLRAVAVQGVEYRQIAVIEPGFRSDSAVAGGELAVHGTQRPDETLIVNPSAQAALLIGVNIGECQDRSMTSLPRTWPFASSV